MIRGRTYESGILLASESLLAMRSSHISCNPAAAALPAEMEPQF
jgi:hypothetical protein